MSFLLNSGRAAASQSSLEDTEDSETQPPNLEVPATVHQRPTIKKPPAKRRKDLEIRLLNYLQGPLSTSVTEPDENKAFFDSLIPTVKTLTTEQKLDFRCEVIYLLKRTRLQNTAYTPLPVAQYSYLPARQYHCPSTSQQIPLPTVVPPACLQDTNPYSPESNNTNDSINFN
jgi:hypothetical protein